MILENPICGCWDVFVPGVALACGASATFRCPRSSNAVTGTQPATSQGRIQRACRPMIDAHRCVRVALFVACTNRLCKAG